MASEFGESFKRMLLVSVMDDQLPRDFFNHEQNHSSQLIKCNAVRAFVYAFNRIILSWLSDLHRINLMQKYEPQSKRTRVGSKLKRLFLTKNNRRTTRKWPYVYLMVLVMCSLVLLVNTYYQYVYDANSLKLVRLRAQLNTSNGRALLIDRLHLDVKKLEHELELKAQVAHKKLKTLGASHIQWTLMIQCAVIFFVKPVFMYLVLAPILYYGGDDVILTARLILDPRDECRVRAKLIMVELRRFVASSFSFAKSRLDQTCKELVLGEQTNDLFENRLRSVIRDRVMIDVVRRISKQHRLTIGRLKRIAIEGRLNQLNRTPAWRDWLELTAFGTILVVISYFTISLIVGHYIVDVYLESKGQHMEFESSQDVLFSLMMMLVIVTCGLNAIFVALINLLTLVDQIGSILRLKKLILNVVKINEIRFNQILLMGGATHDSPSIIDQKSGKSSSGGSDNIRACPIHGGDVVGMMGPKIQAIHANEFAESVELDLLTTIIQCRLSCRTFKLARKQISNSALMIIFVVVSIAVMLRIHSAYYHPELKKSCILIGLVCAATGFLFLIPLGMLHEQMILTFKALWSLVAQMSRPQMDQMLDTESSIAIMTLRREIADSTMSKFACTLLLMPITYGNLIRAAFWICLVMIPLMDGTITAGSSGFISDPFRLYSFT